MNIFQSDFQIKNKIEINFLNLTLLFFIFRVSVPLFKYPFLVLYLCLISYFIYIKIKENNFEAKLFILNYWLLLVIFTVFITSIFFTQKLYLIVFKNAINTLVLISFLVLYSNIIKTELLLKQFYINLIQNIFLFGILITAFRLIEIFDIIQIPGNNTFDIGLPLIDRNFSILPILMAFIVAINYLNQPLSLIKKVGYNMLLLFFSLSLILSGSKRGVLVFLVIVLVLFILKILNIISEKINKKYILKNFNLFFTLLFILILIIYLFFFKATPSFREKTLSIIGSNDIVKVKNNISKNVYRNIGFFTHKSPIEFQKYLWTHNINPKDPSTWENLKTHQVVSTLKGNNVEIVPNGSKGYLMDSTCNGIYFKNTNHISSLTLIENLFVEKHDSYKVSVYCYLSEDFNGSIARVVTGSNAVNDNVISSQVSAVYDINKKGGWQKLEFEFQCINKGYVPIYLSFRKNNANSFSNLKGYIIFAYPEIKKVYFSDSLNSSVNVQNKIGQFNKKSNFLSDKQMIYLSSFSSTVFFIKLIKNDPDPIRDFVAKIISEDTTYYPYQQNLDINLSKNFGEDRILRWKFALEIYTIEYNRLEKIFGSGFDFLNWYGYIFEKDKKAIDYPHNPFLHILLYSGILGLLLYIYMLYEVLKYYIKYRKEYGILFIFFIIIYFFTFFSGGNPFDPPVMGFFMILPFFIYSVHKRTEKENKIVKEELEKEK